MRIKYLLKQLLMLVSTLCIAISAYANPNNDDCSLAIPLDPVLPTGQAQYFNNANATDSPQTEPSCEYYDGGDVWFRLTMPMSGHLAVEVMSGTNLNPCLTVYRGPDCNQLVEYDCRYDGSDTNNGSVIIHDTSIGGEELYVRVFQYNSSTGGTFGIQAFEPDIPDNDFCNAAVTLPVNGSCIPMPFINHCTTDSPAGINTSCGYRGSDVWFRALVPASGHLVIDAMAANNPDPVVSVYTGNCSNLNSYECRHDGSMTNDGRVVINDANLAGTYVFFNVYRYFNRNGGTFELCLYEPNIPDNDLCSDAINLGTIQSSVCTPVNFTNEFTTASYADADPSCGLFSGGDVWFSFTMSNTGKLAIDLDPGTNELPHMALYSGTCGNFTEIDCKGYAFTGDHKIILNDPALANQTLYLRVFQYYQRNGGTFDMCIFEPNIPDNDLCSGATYVNVNAICTQYTYSNEFTTESTDAPTPSCGIFKGADVWFSFTMPQSGHLVADVYSGTNTEPVLTLYTGSCGNFTQYDCHFGGLMVGYSRVIVHDETLVGQTVYLRVFGSNQEDGGTFDLCLFEPDIPDNDQCNAPIYLPVSPGQCTQQTFSNLYTTASTNAPNPTCGNYQGGDVWFALQVPASGHLLIDAIAGTNENPAIALFSGSCGNMTQYHCQYGGGVNAGESRILINDSDMAGELLYLRVYRYYSREGGTFDLCVFEPDIPDNDYCSDAIDLGTINIQCTATTFTNEYTTSSLNTPSPSCGIFLGGDVWFTLQMPASGHLVIDGLSGSNPDPVLGLYTGSCGTLVEYDCRDSDSQTDDGRIVVHDESLAGQTLYLRAYRYYNRNGGTFDLCLFEPEMPDNDFIISPIDLGTITPSCNMTTYSNEYATDSPFAAPDCGLYRGGDVWFTAQVPASGRLIIDTDILEIDPVLTVYTGYVTSLVQYQCNENSSVNDNAAKILIDDLSIANQNVFIRAHNFYNRNGGAFNLCAFEPIVPQNQDCNTATQLTVTANPSYNYFSNEFASPGFDNSPGCANYQGGDVWFTVDVPMDGRIILDTKEVQINNSGMSVYVNSCGGLVEYACDDNGGAENMARIQIDDTSLGGQTLYVQVWRSGSPYGGFFGISSHAFEALEVDLVDFTAQLIERRRVLLNWITANEIENDYFEIERSTDGVNFVNIGRADGAGNSTINQYYQFIDEQPVPGINYYRLKDIDFNGNYNYSSTISVKLDEPLTEVTITPNPFDKELLLYFDEPLDYSANVRLTDALGRTIFETVLEEGTVNYYIEIDAELDRGIYFISVMDSRFGIQKYASKLLKN